MVVNTGIRFLKTIAYKVGLLRDGRNAKSSMAATQKQRYHISASVSTRTLHNNTIPVVCSARNPFLKFFLLYGYFQGQKGYFQGIVYVFFYYYYYFKGYIKISGP